MLRLLKILLVISLLVVIGLYFLLGAWLLATFGTAVPPRLADSDTEVSWLYAFSYVVLNVFVLATLVMALARGIPKQDHEARVMVFFIVVLGIPHLAVLIIRSLA